MRKSRIKIEKDNSERWLLTYADLMNLLLILFILLYTLRTVDATKYINLSKSLNISFGGQKTTAMPNNGGGQNSLSPTAFDTSSAAIPSFLEEQQLQEIAELVNAYAKNEFLAGSIDVSIEERGVNISISARVLFKSGSAAVEEPSVETILKIGKIITSFSGKHVIVEGHTDTDPINTAEFPDNLELSTARANSVLRILVSKAGIAPEIISAAGYGEFRPKVPNTTAENKAINRRVDIVVLKSLYSKSEPQ